MLQRVSQADNRLIIALQARSAGNITRSAGLLWFVHGSGRWGVGGPLSVGTPASVCFSLPQAVHS
jgi:hypothetical protein